MAAGVRLRSKWGVAVLACLIIVHFNGVDGLPLLGGQGEHQVDLSLLEEDASSSILEQLAEAERVGSGEAAYNSEQGGGGTEVVQTPQYQQSQSLIQGQLPVSQVTAAVSKAAQVGLLAGLENDLTEKSSGEGAQHSNDMFSQALEKWDAEKTALTKAGADNKVLMATDLGDRQETRSEQQTLISPLATSEVSSLEPEPLQLETSTRDKSEEASDPLAAFQREFSSSLDGGDEMKLPLHVVHKHDGVSNEKLAVQVQVPSSEALKLSPEGNSEHGWMTDALAAWGQEQDSSLDLDPLHDVQRGERKTQSDSLVEKTNDAESSDDLGESNDLGESSDLGESDNVDATAATAEKSLDSEIEAEAQEAASEVVESTMKAVERDFLYTEKAITHKLGQNSPELTLKDLDRAGGKTKHEMVKTKAKKVHKEMLHKAKLNFELAIANVHKQSQQQLANELSGLKVKLRESEDKVLSESKVQQQNAKEAMEKSVRDQAVLALQKMQATLPAKMAQIREKAQTEAQTVASMAIQQITKGAKKVRMRLRQDLGEAAGRVRSAEAKLASSDSNPALALKSAVDVRTEKSKYHKLHDLAESALVQQKSKAAKSIVKAEANAKESVRLAVKTAESKELKEAREGLSRKQKELEEKEQKQLEAKIVQIKEMAQLKIREERKTFKSLVDAAVNMAPKKEKALRMKAKVALHKAKIAAAAYEEQMISSLAPHTVDGKVVTKEMAAECVKNPSGCSLFTLKNENTAAAAKFAESKARKAKRAQKQAKEGVAKALEKLKVTTQVSQKYAQEARDMDDKETRIKLAKLQLNEAKAAAAFHSAAKAHLQTQLVHSEMSGAENDASSKLKVFEQALQEMKVTHSEATLKNADKAKASKAAAFEKAREAAQALLKLSAPPA